jgi:hypothetical protein
MPNWKGSKRAAMMREYDFFAIMTNRPAHNAREPHSMDQPHTLSQKPPATPGKTLWILGGIFLGIPLIIAVGYALISCLIYFVMHETHWEYQYDGFSVLGMTNASMLVVHSSKLPESLEIQLNDGTNVDASTFAGEQIPEFLGAPALSVSDPRLGGTARDYHKGGLIVRTLNDQITEIKVEEGAFVRNHANGQKFQFDADWSIVRKVLGRPKSIKRHVHALRWM